MAALGEDRHLYLRLEELVVDRAIDPEEAIFNLGVEHGVVQGRADALAATLRRQGARGRELAKRLAQIAVNDGPRPSRPLSALLEVAWALALGVRRPPARTPTRRKDASSAKHPGRRARQGLDGPTVPVDPPKTAGVRFPTCELCSMSRHAA